MLEGEDGEVVVAAIDDVDPTEATEYNEPVD